MKKKIKVKKGSEVKVVRYKDSVKNPDNAMNVNEVRVQRDTPVDYKPTLMNKLMPGKVTQKEYNKYYDIKPDSTVTKKKK